MALVKARWLAARAVVLAAAVASIGIAAPTAHANEMTIDDGGTCDVSATVWWNVPPPQGQRPVGFSVSWGCIHTTNPWQYLPALDGPSLPPITINLPIEP